MIPKKIAETLDTALGELMDYVCHHPWEKVITTDEIEDASKWVKENRQDAPETKKQGVDEEL